MVWVTRHIRGFREALEADFKWAADVEAGKVYRLKSAVSNRTFSYCSIRLSSGTIQNNGRLTGISSLCEHKSAADRKGRPLSNTPLCCLPEFED